MRNDKSIYLHSINWFRGIAIIFVVFSHLTGLIGPDHTSQYIKSFFYNGTFFFVFISGYLFWHLIHRFTFSTYLKSKFKNVISPYIFIIGSTLIGLYVLSQFNVTFNDIQIQFLHPFQEGSGFLWHFLVGGSINIPLWFIPMISLIFVSSYAIYKISYYSWLFGLVFLTTFSFSMLSFRPEALVEPYYMYAHFLGIFFLGIFMKKNESLIYANAGIISVLSFFVFLLFVYLSSNQHINTGELVPLLQSNYSINNIINLGQVKMFFGVVFFLSLLFIFEKKGNLVELKKSFLIKSLELLAKLSFGIFFIHFYVIYLITNIFKDLISGTNFPVFFYFLEGTLVLIISALLVFFTVQLLQQRSRYFIGS